MKRKFLSKTASYALLSAGILIACQKEQLQIISADATGTLSSVRPQAIAKTHGLILKSFSHSNRTYHLQYSPNGLLDSIIVTGRHPYVYRVRYKGTHLDSVLLVDGGRSVSVHRNFGYKGNMITSYDYYDRLYNVPYPWTYTFTFDGQKRMTGFERWHYKQMVNHSEFSYDAADNIVTWNDFSYFGGNYTYDNQLNPLHLVPDLFAIMIEDQWVTEYSFSAHNSVTHTFFSGGGLSFQNQYNIDGQLLAKLLSDNGPGLSFSYQ
ncbi:MAG TPA: hypothetical protein VNT20_20935 [Flavisolibacter sp.]|jgi:hypothetical protein|nr:hypothetical protein [Flavisolibacter sp.]